MHNLEEGKNSPADGLELAALGSWLHQCIPCR
jgi:hypothetical protein